jgi:tRNA(fMet)-specific endonuclease VapC
MLLSLSVYCITNANGQDIGVMDTLIAAHALSQNLILVSNNLNHFKRISQLRVETWL